jgi:hypothetical protein
MHPHHAREHPREYYYEARFTKGCSAMALFRRPVLAYLLAEIRKAIPWAT